MTKRFGPYLRLLRVPNVFTAAADVVAGFLISHGTLAPWGECALLVVASCCLYLGGMALNDYFDRQRDRVHRPERPLPSGQIPALHALLLGLGLLAGGTVAGSLAGPAARNLAGLLAACVLLYDAVLKPTMVGPLLMGLCRALNVLLGMSTAAGAIWLFDLAVPQQWRLGTMVAAGIGLYIMGVTRIARYEAARTTRIELTSTVIGFNLGLLLVALVSQASRLGAGFVAAARQASEPYFVAVALGQVGPAGQQQRLYAAACLWAAVLAVTNGFAWRAVACNNPVVVRQAVKACIFALVGLDAAVVAFFCGPAWAAAVLALLLPAVVIGQWVPTS